MEENKEKNGMTVKIIGVIAIIVLIAIIGTLCMGYYKKKIWNIDNPIVTMEVKDYGTIKLELYPDKAPETVSNFVALANNGYYNGTKFHRVIKDFMIQGGDSKGDGTGGVTFKDLYNNEDENAKYEYSDVKATSDEDKPTASDEYTIKGEFLANGYEDNDLNLTKGTLAMARADYTQYSPTLSEKSYNSAGSQFFIMTTDDHTSLSGYYAGFGKVIEGMDVVEKIAGVKVEAPKSDDEQSASANTEASKPVKDVVIEKVTVETDGIDYGFPSTLEPFDMQAWFQQMYGNFSTQQ